jgi:hypothetical protein
MSAEVHALPPQHPPGDAEWTPEALVNLLTADGTTTQQDRTTYLEFVNAHAESAGLLFDKIYRLIFSDVDATLRANVSEMASAELVLDVELLGTVLPQVPLVTYNTDQRCQTYEQQVTHLKRNAGRMNRQNPSHGVCRDCFMHGVV